MNTIKIVLVIQDLKVKDGSTIAVVSGDVHYFKTAEDKVAYTTLEHQIDEEKDLDKKFKLETEQSKYKTIASFQMSLDNNKEFQRQIQSLVAEAIRMKEEK